MKLRKPYMNYNSKKYKDLKKFFSKEIEFSINDNSEEIKEKLISEDAYVSRVWLLFASHDNNPLECLQVAHSKKGVQKEITDVIDFLFNSNQDSENISFSNSAFYEKVCPIVTDKEDYRKFLYSKIISNKYEYFWICFLDVDKYLGTKPNNNINATDTERIIQICKNQYAEAKIAYQTLAVYWRQYPSGIDGQTIAYIVDHPSEFNE